MCPLVVDEEEVSADMGVDMGEWEDHHMTHLILVPQLILMLSPMVVVVVVLGHLMTHGVQEEDQR
jgi:hypothetical protein